MRKFLLVLIVAIIAACTQKTPEAATQVKNADDNSYYINEKVVVTGKGVTNNGVVYINIKRAANPSQTAELTSENWEGLDHCGCSPEKLAFYNAKQKGDVMMFKKLAKSRFK
jgi:hypothetical protein